MTKRSLPLKVRVAFEPNRFSSECLVKVYEKLGPMESRSIALKTGQRVESKSESIRKGSQA